MAAIVVNPPERKLQNAPLCVAGKSMAIYLLSRILKISILAGFCYLDLCVVDHEKDCAAAIAEENKLCYDIVKNILSRYVP